MATTEPGAQQAAMNAMPVHSSAAAWLDKADADLTAAEVLLASGEDRVLLNACYMAQQCIEKTLKALLVFRMVEVGGCRVPRSALDLPSVRA